MKNIISTIATLGVVLASSQAYSEKYNFKPGLWETTSTSKILEIDAPAEVEQMMRGVAGMQKPTETECIKNIDAMFESETDDEECNTNVEPINKNKFLVVMNCSDEDGSSKGIGEVNLNGKSFSSSLKITTNQESIKMTMEIVGTGKYIGECK